MTHKFIKAAGVKNEKEFYKKYPNEEDFFNAFPHLKAENGMQMIPDNVFPPKKKFNFTQEVMDDAMYPPKPDWYGQPVEQLPRVQMSGQPLQLMKPSMQPVEPKKKSNFDLSSALALGIAGVSALIPQDQMRNPVVQPYENYSYNPNPKGTGSSALMKKGGKLPDGGKLNKQLDKEVYDIKFNTKESENALHRYTNRIGRPLYADQQLQQQYENSPLFDYNIANINVASGFNNISNQWNTKLKQFPKQIQNLIGNLPTMKESDVQKIYKNGGIIQNPMDDFGKRKRNRKMQGEIPNNYSIYSGVIDENGKSINNPTELQSIQTMIKYMKNNWSPEADSPSNTYRPQFQHILFNEQAMKPSNTAEYGTKLQAGNGLQLLGKGNTEQLDSNTVQFNGPSHDNGGIPIDFDGSTVEVEGGETGHKSMDGSLNIMGNLVNPITGNKFKSDSKMLAKKEAKVQKYIDLGTELVNNNDPKNKWEMLKFNSGKAMLQGGDAKKKEILIAKEHLANVQNTLLEMNNEDTTKAKNGLKIYAANGAKVDPVKDYEEQKASFQKVLKNPSKYYKWEVEQAREFMKNPSMFYNGLIQYNNKAIKTGSKETFWKDQINDYNEVLNYLKNPKKYSSNTPKVVSNEKSTNLEPMPELKASLKKYADKYKVDYNLLEKLVTTESNFSPTAQSNKNAQGIMQFIPSTAKMYGISEAQLKSKKPEDIQAVMEAGVHHFSDLLQKNNNDPKLALAAYNGGQKSVDFVKGKLKKNTISGDEWINFMESRNKTTPTNKKHAWQNETLKYVKGISGVDKTFDPVKYREEFYYDPEAKKSNPPLDLSVGDLPHNENNQQAPINQPTKLTDYQFNFTPGVGNKKFSNAEPLKLEQTLGEAYGVATNNLEPVFMQQYQPDLYNPYQVSFQDRINQNNRTFNAIEQSQAYNPEALASLSAETYLANNNVAADEFRTNQAIASDITNKNISLLNEAKGRNLGLADLQFTRQTQEKATRNTNNQNILNSLSSKMLQKEADNNALRVYENLYNYRFDPQSKEKIYLGPQASDEIDWNNPQSTQSTGSKTITTGANGELKNTKVAIDNPIKQQTDILKLKKLQDEGSIPMRKWFQNKKVNLQQK